MGDPVTLDWLKLRGSRTRARNLVARSWLLGFRFRNRHVRLGHHLRFNGLPIFAFDRRAAVEIGDYATFTSRPRGNLAGLSKRCTLFAGPGSTLKIGTRCGFSGVSIFCARRIEIGNHLTCGANVSIWDTDFHPLQHVDRRSHVVDRISTAPVRIGDDVFVGANTLVLKGVTIGDRVVIGAGTVVTTSVPADEIWAGNPARFIRRLAG